MKFAKRLAYFSGGFTIGIILLFFILSGKKTSCDYGIQARTLKNIRLKERNFSAESLAFFERHQLDTSQIDSLLLHGRVLFKESDVRRDSCNYYVVKGKISEKPVKIKFENCEKLTTVMEAFFEE